MKPGWHLGGTRLTIAALSVAGMGVSAYLWSIRGAGAAECFGLGDCVAVNASPYSELAGVPVAVLGVALYVVLFGVALAWLRAPLHSFSLLPLVIFGVAAAGFAFSAWLTYVELFIIEAVCPWCVASALIITAIFGLSLAELLRGHVPEPMAARGAR